MYTQCPHCQTAFRIYPDQLSQARGQVRCGVCNFSFNALESLTENISAARTIAERAPETPETIEPPNGEPLPSTEETPAPPPLPEPEIETAETATAPEAEETPASLPPEAEGIETELVPEVEEEQATQPPEEENIEPEVPIETATPPAAVVTIKEAIAPPPSATTPSTMSLEETAAGEAEPIDTESTEAPTPESPAWVGMAEPETNEVTAEETASEPIVTEPEVEASTPVEKTLPDLGIIAAEPRASTDEEELTEPEEKAAQGFKTGLWTLVNVVLILVLLGQYAYYNRSDLSQYPQLRPWLVQMCSVLGCDMPLQRDVQRIVLTKRIVESDPNHANALLIDATLVNNADFPQAYPILEIRFSDLNNQLVAGRRFKPKEYLPAGTALQAGMAPHQPVHLVLEIVDPGKDAVSFKFEIL